MNTRSARSIIAAQILCALAGGCAATGTRPHDMSAADHAAAANAAADAAEAHRAQWTSSGDDAHQRMAAEQKRLAAAHRAASAALRDAEAAACAGLEEDARDMTPFNHTDDIAAVSELYGSGFKGARGPLIGATVLFRAVPGMTTEWLQRVVSCHVARNAALGNVMPEMPDCPLVPRGVAASVHSTGDGFAVEIKSDDASVAKEIVARAARLHTTPAAPP